MHILKASETQNRHTIYKLHANQTFGKVNFVKTRRTLLQTPRSVLSFLIYTSKNSLEEQTQPSTIPFKMNFDVCIWY